MQPVHREEVLRHDAHISCPHAWPVRIVAQEEHLDVEDAACRTLIGRRTQWGVGEVVSSNPEISAMAWAPSCDQAFRGRAMGMRSLVIGAWGGGRRGDDRVAVTRQVIRHQTRSTAQTTRAAGKVLARWETPGGISLR